MCERVLATCQGVIFSHPFGTCERGPGHVPKGACHLPKGSLLVTPFNLRKGTWVCAKGCLPPSKGAIAICQRGHFQGDLAPYQGSGAMLQGAVTNPKNPGRSLNFEGLNHLDFPT